MKHVFRIASLLVPSWLAWYIACSVHHRSTLAVVVSWALGPVWIAVTAALLLRAIVVIVGRKRDGSTPVLASIDILTSSGVALGRTTEREVRSRQTCIFRRRVL